MIRVLVVEDSITVRKRLIDVLSADPGIEIVGEADDGQQAIELCQRLRPDVVTLDMMLPVMSGLAATEYIMAYCPTPILIVSSSTNRGELFKTYEALAAGALDVLEKNSEEGGDGVWEAQLVSTVKLISRIKVITHPRARLATSAPTRTHAMLSVAASAVRWRPIRAILIGASTGGPAALLALLGALPGDFPIPIVIVLHIGDSFASAFADWLDGQTSLRVSYARDGELLPPVGEGRVLLAPPDVHLVVRHDCLRHTRDAPRHSCRPSVDVLFGSAAVALGDQSVACLLTGMGRDGAEGLLAIRRAGGRTIAQDEASSVVFGMPREAILLGAAEQVLPLDQIASTLIQAAREQSARRVG